MIKWSGFPQNVPIVLYNVSKTIVSGMKFNVVAKMDLSVLVCDFGGGWRKECLSAILAFKAAGSMRSME